LVETEPQRLGRETRKPSVSMLGSNRLETVEPTVPIDLGAGGSHVGGI
jgi:hypothetical protein